MALHMLDGGDWWIPRLSASKPHLTKPPLTYWTMAAGFKAFGRSEWAARLPNALAFGLAFLTKGPPGLLPLATLVVWTVWHKPRLGVRQLFEPVGVALFLLLSFGWFATLVVGHHELVAYFLKYEFVDRIFSDTHDRNPGWGSIVKIYASALIGGALPWLVPAALRLRRVNSHRVGGLDAPLYVLPLFVSLALLIARGVVPCWHERRSLLLACLGTWVLALVTLKGVASHAPSTRNAEQLARRVAHAIQRMRRPADGIAFVAGKPFYGLRLYLELPIERVGMASGERVDGALFDLPDICEEIRAHGHPLWLVQAWRVAEFTERAAACGAVVKTLQVGVEGWQSFEVAPSSTAHTSSATLTGQ